LSLMPSQDNGAETPLHLSRIDMSVLLGLTVETVSRIMAELSREGIIHAPRGRIVVRARKRLKALAGEPLGLSPSGKPTPRRSARSRGAASSPASRRRHPAPAGTA
jgi:Crp-like helix-turn-helix domain